MRFQINASIKDIVGIFVLNYIINKQVTVYYII